MTTLTAFFRGPATTLGVFYPIHSLTAVFRDEETARRAAAKLRVAGFSRDEVIAVNGLEILEFDRERKTLGGALMQAVSRFFKTEQSFTDHDCERAREGAGFLVAKCPNKETKSTAWSILKSEHPLDARYYSMGSIEHLAGDPNTD